MSFLLISCSNINTSEIDNLLINKTLDELIKNEKVFYSGFKGEGEIVIYDNSLKIKPEYKIFENKRHKKEQCILSKELIESVSKNNKRTLPLKGVLKQSNFYRFQTKEENDRRNVVKNIFSGQVKSYISISKPGYSENGEISVILISYTYSMHASFARFIYTKKSNIWELECSEFVVHI